MNIFNHLIPDSAIVGIGPLMSETQEVKIDFSYHSVMRFYFHLHLAAHTTTISSRWFQEEKEKDYSDEILDWRQEYFRLRNRISEAIGEPTDSRLRHVQHVESLHEKIEHNLSLMLSHLQPVEDDPIPINA